MPIRKKDEVEDLPPRSEVEFIVSLTDIQIKNWGIESLNFYK